MAHEPNPGSADDGPGDADAAVHGFLAALAESHAATTRHAYRQDMTEFLEWCRSADVSALAIQADQVQHYIDFLLDTVPSRTDGPPIPAVSRKLAVLSGFFAHAVEAELMPTSPMPGVEVPRVRVERRSGARLSEEDVAQLLAAAKTHSLRAHALFTVLARTGLRLGEALARDVEDLVLAEGRTVLRFYRNARTGVVDFPLAVPVFQAIARYLDGRESGPLFTTTTGRRLDQPAVFRLLRRTARVAGLPQQDEINPQFLREYFITSSLDSGEDPERVHAAAGLTHPVSARRYARPE